MPATEDVLLLLGGNRDDPPTLLARAVDRLQQRAGTVLARSRAHWTEPWGFSDPHLFLNQAVLLRTALDPEDLLRTCLAIETELGRVRSATQRYTARTIDIDVLLYGDRVVEQPGLQLPHPRMHERSFALAPAADIAPAAVHPLLRRTILQLLTDLRPTDR